MVINDIIINFIEDVCFVLDMDVPILDLNESMSSFESKVRDVNDTFYISETDEPDADYLFNIAHELRIRWQYLTNPEHFDHKPVEEIGPDEFSNQVSEIDANAFATVYMIHYFQLFSKLKKLSEHTQDQIIKQMKVIELELGFS